METELNSLDELPSPTEVQEALDQVLHSRPFAASKQCKTLLKYLVKNALTEQDENLKERTIGIEVFGRRLDYNTAEDPIVRARVGEVRKRLAQYYSSDETKGRSAIQISIPVGAYKPIFCLSHEPALQQTDESRPAHQEEHQEFESAQAPPPKPALLSSAKWHLLAGITIGLAALLLVLAGWHTLSRLNQNELDLFWQPILVSGRPILIHTGSAPAYTLSDETFRQELSRIPGSEDEPVTEFVLAPLQTGQVMSSKDLVVDPDGFAAPGDVVANVKIASLLTAHHRAFDLRTGHDLPFADLRKNSIILIGALDNYWTLDLTGRLRFFFDRQMRIRDRSGQHHIWSTVRNGDGLITEDYAIVFRVVDSKTGGPVLAIAGITSCGTRAAGDFVTDREQMKKLRNVPHDVLTKKNIEIVLHTSLDHCEPVTTDVTAVYSW